jgi:hypothetical protein
MAGCQLVVVNGLTGDLELNLSPWRGAIVSLRSGLGATLLLDLPTGAWVEVDVTDTSVFVHGWPGTTCHLEVDGDSSSGGTRQWTWDSSESDLASLTVRSRSLAAWAETLPAEAMRAVITDERQGAGLITIGDASARGSRAVRFSQRAVAEPALCVLAITPRGVAVSGDGLGVSANGDGLPA